jgi:hypothetical protein
MTKIFSLTALLFVWATFASAQGSSNKVVPNGEDLYQMFKKESTTDRYYTQFLKADVLYTAAISNDPSNQGMFYGYVIGVLDSLQAEGFEGLMLLHDQAVSLGAQFLDDEALNGRWVSWLQENTRPAKMCIPAGLGIAEVGNFIRLHLQANVPSLPTMSARFAIREALRSKGWHGKKCVG